MIYREPTLVRAHTKHAKVLTYLLALHVPRPLIATPWMGPKIKATVPPHAHTLPTLLAHQGVLSNLISLENVQLF